MKLDYHNRCFKPIIALSIILVAVILNIACTSLPVHNQLSELQNKGLVIRYLTVQKEVAPLRRAQVFCAATDADDGDINYQWSATGGEVQATQEPGTAWWLAPRNTGDYKITVVVTNAKGAKITRSVNIKVTNDPMQYPFVFSMTCLECNNGIGASRFSEYAIRCDILPQIEGKVHYTWFASQGLIKGDGPRAIWYTGGRYGNALITVIATDEEGNEIEGYLAINVNCCN